MGKKKGCQDCPDTGRDMSRGDFLKTSAVAAGGVAVGGEGLREEPSGAPEGDCPPDCSLENRDPAWVLPAGILNILWGDVFPRVAAMEWETVGAGVVPGTLLSDLVAKLPPLPTPPQTPNVYESRVDKLRGYFSGSTHVVPFRIPAEGGFDFILSNRGLDFFLPPKPELAVEVFRFYAYRRTGRAAIGVPGYLTEAVSALSIDSPSGPSQIGVDADVVLGEVEVELGLSAQTCLAVRCLRKKLGRPIPGEEGYEQDVRDVIAAYRTRSAGQRVEEPKRPVSLPGFEAFACLMSGFRCWQIQGSVTRAIFTELPRIVATRWMEDELINGYCQTPQPNPPVKSGLYRVRMANGGDSGLREIFEERLETSLPHDDVMHFTFGHPSTYAGLPGWDVNDVMLTDIGIFFPSLPSRPNLTTMFAEMAAGNVGNPVFTDTRRTLLDEP